MAQPAPARAPGQGPIRHPLHLLRGVLPGCVLASCISAALAAADDDLFTTIDPILATATLAHLRDTLGQTPASDPRLGLAEMALVDLALTGDPRDCGGRGGVWRQRARELRDSRRAAGAVPDSFAAAIPDLWVDALDGASAACLTALDHFPRSADEPQARAVRCWATGDWRPLRAQAVTTVHERLALAVAYGRSHMGQSIERLDRSGLPPFAYATLQNMAEWYNWEGTYGTLRHALRLVPAIAASPQLPDSAASSIADLAGSLRLSGTPPLDTRASALLAAMDQGDLVLRWAPMVAGWRLADAGTMGPAGIRDAHGAWSLIGLGDWSAATRLAIVLSTWHCHDYLGYSWETLTYGDPIFQQEFDAELGIFGAMQRLNASGYRNEEAGREVLAGIAAELSRPAGGLPPCRLIGFADEVRHDFKRLAGESQQIIERLLAAQSQAEAGRAAGWQEVGRQAQRAGLLERIPAALQAAAAADPWSPELERLARESRVPGKAPAAPLAADDELLLAQIGRMPWRFDPKTVRFAALLAARNLAEAATVGAEMAAIDPGNEEVGRHYGAVLRESGRIPEAIAAWRAYQASSIANDAPFVSVDIGSALESTGDVAGAERDFTAAGESGRDGAMLDCAKFFLRHGQGDKALAWVERKMQRYGADDLDILAATCMLTGSPTPAAVTAALKRGFSRKRAITYSAYTWDLLGGIRRLGLHDRLLPLFDPAWRTAGNGMALRVGLIQLEAGHPADAAASFSALAGTKGAPSGVPGLPPGHADARGEAGEAG